MEHTSLRHDFSKESHTVVFTNLLLKFGMTFIYNVIPNQRESHAHPLGMTLLKKVMSTIHISVCLNKTIPYLLLISSLSRYTRIYTRLCSCLLRFFQVVAIKLAGYSNSSVKACLFRLFSSKQVELLPKSSLSSNRVTELDRVAPILTEFEQSCADFVIPGPCFISIDQFVVILVQLI